MQHPVPLPSSLERRLLSFKQIVDTSSEFTLVNSEVWLRLIILTLSVRTEGADEQPAKKGTSDPALASEGAADPVQAQWVTE
jgi:hypothetical protein